MARFSKRSNDRLGTCDPDIQKVMQAVVTHFDITVLEGHRDEDRQNELQRQGKSRLKYPESKHNAHPSKAVDIAPFIPGKGIDWEDTAMFHFMAGRVLATAEQLGVKLRWGGDWNRNSYSGDEKFLDLVHFELDE